MNKTALKKIFKFFGVPIYGILAKWSRGVAGHMHKMLYYAEWCIDNPENFDHDLDLYWQWKHRKVPHWLERGVYNLLAIKNFKDPILYELCCGDGFNAAYFYSSSCKQIWACDFDKKAITKAKKERACKNIVFQIADIRTGIPDHISEGYPTNVVWDAAIEHFTPVEIDNLMKRIRDVLEPQKGILSGMTIVERNNGEKSLSQHEYEFKNMDDLKRFFEPYFNNVIVWETIYPDRHNLYFMASNGVLPFTKEYGHWTSKLV